MEDRASSADASCGMKQRNERNGGFWPDSGRLWLIGSAEKIRHARQRAIVIHESGMCLVFLVEDLIDP